MAEVFRAFDTRLNRPVALKVLRRTNDDRIGPALQRFLREARSVSALNHPNIIIIHEIGETADGDHYIVQEYIDGKTLRSLLGDLVPVPTIAEVGGQIARALNAAHAAGIAHRDVKPENIMIRADGLVKVLDFGLARQVVASLDRESTLTNFQTAAGVVIGTPAYMAPEQASGLESGPPADVFGFGVVLYEMAAGRRPFVAATRLGVVAAVIGEQPVPPVRLNSAVPSELNELILRMIEKDPALRPTMREVEGALATMRGGAMAVEVPLPMAATRATTVGRESQRAQLARAYARVSAGRGLIVAVTGEPGMGKTSVIEDFFADLESRGERPTIARGRCSENLAGNEAYLPILEMLDQLLHRRVGLSLDTLIKTVAPTWYVQVAARTAEVASLRAVAPAASQERMKRELGALLQELSRTHPLVLFIDDLHWADVSTIDMLNYLAGHFGDLRVLILTSYRPSDMALAKHPFLGIRSNLQSRGVFEEVGLNFLEARDVDDYLAAQFPGHQFPRDLTTVIHTKTEGSPLFMADLVRYLRDTGGIAQQDGTWVLLRTLSDVPRDLPESVRGMIARKIEQLDEEDRRLLLAASVQGHEFDSAIVAEAISMDPAEVEERLESLERVQAFVRRGEEFEFADATLTLRYQFVHVLYQNVLYASLQPTRRAALSSRIVTALATHYGKDAPDIAGKLALLYETARDFANSAKFFYLAAQRAATLFAFREALALAERGLKGLRGLPDGPPRQQLELGLQLMRGSAFRAVKGWAAPEVESAFARARELCQQLQDPPQLMPVLWNLSFFHMIRGDLGIVRAQVNTHLAQAEALGHHAYIMAMHHVAGVTAEFMGDFVESHELLERARELHDPSQHRVYTDMFGMDPGMVARAMSARPLWVLGRPDAALARSRETLALSDSQRQPVTRVFSLIVLQSVHLFRGETAEAIRLGNEIIAIGTEYEFPQEVEWGRAFQGSAIALAGGADDGVVQLQRALSALQDLKSGLVRTLFLSHLADALHRAGRVDEGLAAVVEGFTHSERTQERGFSAELHRLRGELLRLGGNRAAAHESMRIALDHARRQQAQSLALRAAISLARLEQGTPGGALAAAELASILDSFTEGHETMDLMAARSVLSEMG